MLRLPLAKFKIKGKVAPVQAQQPRRAPWRNPRMITGDMLILVPANALADSRDGANTFVYEFGWKSPVDRLGGCHALEIGFVFDTLRSPNSITLAGPTAPQPLADVMRSHHETDQILTFASGSGEADIAGQTTRVNQGDRVAVPAGTRHNFRNTGANPLVLSTVYGPPNHAMARYTRPNRTQTPPKSPVRTNLPPDEPNALLGAAPLLRHPRAAARCSRGDDVCARVHRSIGQAAQPPPS